MEKKEIRELTVKEAIEQGYTMYCFNDDGFQGLRDIEDVDDEDLSRNDIRLVEKEHYHPSGLSSKDIAEILAEHIEVSHYSDSGDDTEAVFNAINDLDFTEAENKISEALSKLKYYRATDIKLIQ